MTNKDKKGFSTRLIHSHIPESKIKSATVPIYQTSTFIFDSAEEGANCFAAIAMVIFIQELVIPQ